MKPVALTEEWSVRSPKQWGEPYLSLADAKDIRFEEA
jgi:hypothetical protein